MRPGGGAIARREGEKVVFHPHADAEPSPAYAQKKPSDAVANPESFAKKEKDQSQELASSDSKPDRESIPDAGGISVTCCFALGLTDADAERESRDAFAGRD